MTPALSKGYELVQAASLATCDFSITITSQTDCRDVMWLEHQLFVKNLPTFLCFNNSLKSNEL